MDADRRRDVALFRYALVRELDEMRPRERGRAVRELAAREHLTPWGELERTGFDGDLVRWVPRSLVLLVLMLLSASMSP